MNPQAELWKGSFGDEYLRRNQVDFTKRLSFWRDIVEQTQCQSAFEFGCSAGHNLIALRKCGVEHLIGADINAEAVKEARSRGLFVAEASFNDLFSAAVRFDLSFTVGVLIHVGPHQLQPAMAAVAAASRKYVLAVEYYAKFDTEVEYRGIRNALWKRDYGHLYAAMGLSLVKMRDLTAADGFDDCRAWLLEKR